MSTIQRQIFDLIGARLLNIKQSNGYFNNADSIKREKISNFKSGDIPILFYWGENDSRVDSEFGYEKRNLAVGAAFFIRTNDNSFTDTAYEAAADIKTALNRAITAPKVSDAASINLAGSINSLSIDDIIPVVGEGQAPFCGVLLTINVEYFANTFDSFTILSN